MPGFGCVVVLLVGLGVNLLFGFVSGVGFDFGVDAVSRVYSVSSGWVGVDFNVTFGGRDCDGGHSVEPTADGGYIIAGFTGSFSEYWTDFWLLKVDSDGDVVWNWTFEGSSFDEAMFAVETGDGGYIAVGRTMSFGAGGYDVWLGRFDAGGNLVWNRTFGGSEDDVGVCVKETSDGGYVVAAETYSYDVAMGDLWLLKLNATGDVEWSRVSGWPDWDGPGYPAIGEDCIWETADGGYVIAGYIFISYEVRLQFWLVKTDAYGNIVWSKNFGGPGDDWAWSLLVASDGGYVLAGDSQIDISKFSDFWIVKTDEDGNLVWSKRFGGSEVDFATDICEAADGSFVVVGSTESFGAGLSDVWLVKFKPIHNLAIINATISKSIVGLGYPLPLSVSIENRGDFVERFNLTIYANSTIIEMEEISLAAGQSKEINLTININDLPKGKYDIIAKVPSTNETDPTDNQILIGQIIVSFPGDVDGDLDVDIYDITAITAIYGSKKGEKNYNPNCDIDNNGKINIYDVVAACTNYGAREK